MSKESYIFPFLWLHGEEEGKLREYMNVIHNSGCSAVCVESRPHPEFCGEKWWKDMDVIIDEAKKLDMKIWILDDSHFPTGFANGAVMKASDELRRQSVYTKIFHVKRGQQTFTCDITKVMKKIPNTLLGKFFASTDKDSKHIFYDDRLLAISARVEGENEPILLMDGNEQKSVNIRLPENTIKVYVTFLTRNCGIHRSYMNMLDHESCRLLIDAVYEPHFLHYGNEFGKTILGFFSDEPEIGNGYYFNNDTKMGGDFDFPWSRELESSMPEILGEKWKTLLPLIWDEGEDADKTAEVRYKYMDAVTRLVEACFSKQIGYWCEEHGVEYIGHIIEDGNAHGRTANSLGHYFRGLSGQHMAGIDDIGGQVLPFQEDAPAEGIFKLIGGRDGEFYHFMLGKLAGSMAYLQPEKKGRSMCEIFGNYGWGEGPRMEKYLADHFMVQGINHFVPHAFSPKPYPDKDCPPHFYANGHNPQYKAFSKVIEYMNRICELISDGRPVLDTAILYHAESEWTGNIMLDQKPARILMENQVDFHIVPTDIFSETERYHTDICSAGLTINGNTYRTLIIPTTDYIRPELADAIEKLSKTECKVIFINALPKGVISDGKPKEAVLNCEVVELGDIVNIAKREGTVSQIKVKPSCKRLRVYHYKKTGSEIYYFVNEDADIFKGTVNIPAVTECVAFDAWSGKYYAQKQESHGDETTLYMKLRPGESRIVIVGEPKENIDDNLYEIIDSMKKEILKFENDWIRSTCRAIHYPAFENKTVVQLPDDYAKKDKKFSGHIAYENSFNIIKNGRILLEITDAGEDVEVFINGKSAGIQILPPFLYDITELVKDGSNDIRIEIVTTLERERGANKGKQAPIGLTGQVVMYRI